MNMFKRLKRKAGFIISRSKFLMPVFRKLNLILFHWDKRRQDKSFGTLNPSVKFYVIRSDGTDEGLLSLYLGRVREIHRRIEEGYTPIIDWQNYKTQYNVDFPVKGTKNAWEYYFEQPCRYSLDDVYKSKNVRLSGWVIRDESPAPEITPNMMEIAPVKKYIYDMAEEKIQSFGIDDMAGILARGTDYTSLKPAGHPIAPTPEEISAKLDEFLERYGSRKIFLATEDENIYAFFREKYGDMIFTSDNELVRNYSGRGYIAGEIEAENKYKFGLDYLVKMICLSRCKYLIAADTAGSRFARLINNGKYIAEYVFRLGTY